MEIKDLIGASVIHKSFGKGVISSAYDRYLEIEFSQNNKQGKFTYPSCFDVFLTLEDEEIAEAVAADLEQWKIDNGTVQKEKLRQKYEKTQEAIKARKLAADEKRQKSGQKAMELRSSYKHVDENKKKE